MHWLRYNKTKKWESIVPIDRYLIFQTLLTLSSIHGRRPVMAIMTAADHKTNLVIYMIQNKVIIIKIITQK